MDAAWKASHVGGEQDIFPLQTLVMRFVWEDHETERAHEKRKKWKRGEKVKERGLKRVKDKNKNKLAHIALGDSVWRLSGNQESRGCLASLWAILLRCDHISSVPPPPLSPISLSSIAHSPLMYSSSRAASHKQGYWPPGKKSERSDPFFWMVPASFPSRTNSTRTPANLKSSNAGRYQWGGGEKRREEGGYTSSLLKRPLGIVRCDWQLGWSPWAGQHRDHTLFTREFINHNLA